MIASCSTQRPYCDLQLCLISGFIVLRVTTIVEVHSLFRSVQCKSCLSRQAYLQLKWPIDVHKLKIIFQYLAAYDPWGGLTDMTLSLSTRAKIVKICWPHMLLLHCNAGGGPHHLQVLLEGESLLNDATSITLFLVFLKEVQDLQSQTDPPKVGGHEFGVIVGNIIWLSVGKCHASWATNHLLGQFLMLRMLYICRSSFAHACLQCPLFTR